MGNLPIPSEFTVEDFKEYLRLCPYTQTAIKSLREFQISCPANFDDFPEREQVLMSFAFLMGYEAAEYYDKHKTKRLPED